MSKVQPCQHKSKNKGGKKVVDGREPKQEEKGDETFLGTKKKGRRGKGGLMKHGEIRWSRNRPAKKE